MGGPVVTLQGAAGSQDREPAVDGGVVPLGRPALVFEVPLVEETEIQGEGGFEAPQRVEVFGVSSPASAGFLVGIRMGLRRRRRGPRWYVVGSSHGGSNRAWRPSCVQQFDIRKNYLLREERKRESKVPFCSHLSSA